MQYFIGFVIALFIALTTVGAGTVTVPILVLFLGVQFLSNSYQVWAATHKEPVSQIQAAHRSSKIPE